MKPQQSSLADDFINAKLRGMRSKLFETDRLAALTDSRSLPELFRRIHPDRTYEGHLEFERAILKDEATQLTGILKYLGGSAFDVFECLLIGLQLENLKVALRLYATHEPRRTAEQLITPLPSWLSIPTEKLFETPDLKSFIMAIPAQLLSREQRKKFASTKTDAFALEMALDKAYMDRLLTLSRSGDDWIKRLVGYDIDRRNLMMLLRAKFVFGLPFSEVQPYLAPAGIFVNMQKARAVMEAPDIKEAAHKVVGAGAEVENAATLTRVEDALNHRLYLLAVRCFAESVLSEASAIAFYYFKRTETMNLIRLTESVRHSLPREEIDSLLLQTAR